MLIIMLHLQNEKSCFGTFTWLMVCFKNTIEELKLDQRHGY